MGNMFFEIVTATAASLLFSIVSLFITKIGVTRRIVINYKEGDIIIEGSEKDIQKQVIKLGEKIFENEEKLNTEEDKEKLESWKDSVEKQVFIEKTDSLKSIISPLIGLEDIWFSLDVIEDGMVKTVYSSRDRFLSNSDTEVRIDTQTEFNNIVKGDEYFFSSNMSEYAKEFTYINANPRWSQEYNSIIVVPITINGIVNGFFCMYGVNAFKKIDSSGVVLDLMKIAAHYFETLVK